MDRSTNMLKASEPRTTFLPQIRLQKNEIRESPARSPASSAKIPKLPPITAGKEALSTEERRYVSAQETRTVQSANRTSCAVCFSETSADELAPPTRTEQAAPKMKRANKTAQGTAGTPEKKSAQRVVSGQPDSRPPRQCDTDSANMGAYMCRPRFGRRKAAQRKTAYQSRSTDETLDSEILAMEESSPHIFAASLDQTAVPRGLRDLNGKKIGSSAVYKEDITSVMGQGERDEVVRLAKSKTTEVRQRFLDALDQHYLNQFRSMDTGRRMAICEELEHTVVVGNITLAWYREHMRVQAALNDWYLY